MPAGREKDANLKYKYMDFISKINFKRLFKEDDGKFYIACGLKLSCVSFFTIVFISYHIWMILSLNSTFFESVGYFKSMNLREAFFDHSLKALIDQLPLIFFFIICIFFVGMYVGYILLRPFAVIGNYCQDLAEKENTLYNPDLFSDYRLLSRFSELFFQYVNQCKIEKKFRPNTMPNYYSKVRGPVLEKVFLFHFLIITTIISVMTVWFCSYLTLEIRSQVIELSLQTLSKNSDVVAYFLNNQGQVFESLLWGAGISVFISYFALCFHLYGKVSGAIFAFFSTMRAIMKGNTNARIHLIGYAHIRPYGRMFNKFMDYSVNEFAKEEKKVKSHIREIDSKKVK